MAAKTDFAKLLVDSNSIPKARRGRKAKVSPELIDALTVVVPGKSLPLGSLYKATTDKTEQSKIGQTIRTHWNSFRSADGKVSISWVDGQPIVSMKANA